ncbi:MAG: GH3 auxin-responsive promoter family protein, partial [Candidatus Sericytochromatia bacterium]
MSLLGRAIRLSAGGAFRRFEAALGDPERAQAEALARLLAAGRQTAFGREHGFSTIRTPEDYARLVPIRDYEGFRPYIQRMLGGEAGVLTTEAPEMYATTSGTTGEPKLVPVTPGWRRQMTGLLRLWMVGALRDHPRCFDGSVLTVVSPAIEGLTASGTPYGAMTGLTQQRAPWLIRRQYATPYEVALVKDYEARYFLLLRLALARSVTAIVTPNPSTLMRLAAVARREGEALLRAIHDGTPGMAVPELLPQAGTDPARARERLLSGLRPDPERARALGRLAEQEGALLPRMAWPDLQLIGCWLGGSAGIQARHLAEAYGEGAALRDVGLLASEGRMTVPLADGGPEGPPYIHANYYEFIPESAIDRPAPPTLGVHQLEDGARYYLVVTGGNGLYRYDMNDIVEVRGFDRRTPRLAFVRKGRDMVNLTGEKLHLNQVQAALR